MTRIHHLALALAGLALLTGGLLLSGCAAKGSNPHFGDAAGRTKHPALARLCSDLFEHQLQFDPLFATRVGDERAHGRLLAPGPGLDARRAVELEALRERSYGIDPAQLSRRDRITYAMLSGELNLKLDELALPGAPGAWNLDPLDGPQNMFLSLAQDQPVATARQREQCLQRWRKIPTYLEAVRTNLERSLAQGRVASATATEKVIAQIDALLETPPSQSVLLTGVTDDTTSDFAHDIGAVVGEEIYPAFRRLRRTLHERIRPAARSDDQPGIMHVPGGTEVYAARIRRETSLGLSPDEIHDIGLAEVARIRAEIAELGQRVFGLSDIAAIQQRLRSDPALHFTSRAEVEAKARESFERARAAVPQLFGRLPESDCVIVRVPEHEEADTTIAYYRRPIPLEHGGDPVGRYFINTYDPTSRPRYDAEVLAYHEAIPGHHLQIALAQELDGLPLFRRHTGSTAFVEGWALYTERLCEELGLYSGDLDRFGVLSFDAWRACRLVVDTGIHAKGWSRQEAIDYMTANTLLATNNVVNEIDRYIAWPGQALAYKLGQLEILDLRAQARGALGDDFDLSEFHDRVLENGAVTLAVLRDYIEDWIADEQRAAAR